MVNIRITKVARRNHPRFSGTLMPRTQCQIGASQSEDSLRGGQITKIPPNCNPILPPCLMSALTPAQPQMLHCSDLPSTVNPTYNLFVCTMTHHIPEEAVVLHIMTPGNRMDIYIYDICIHVHMSGQYAKKTSCVIYIYIHMYTCMWTVQEFLWRILCRNPKP